MGKYRQHKQIAVEHLKTQLKINKFYGCKDCPLRIYQNEEAVITFGVGNIQADDVMILPNYDADARIGYLSILSILEQTYNELTGLDIFENYYITRLIKCYSINSFNLEDYARKHCIIHLRYELSKLKPKKVINFDKKLEFHGDYKSINVISPAVMYYDNQSLKDKFIEQLSNAIGL